MSAVPPPAPPSRGSRGRRRGAARGARRRAGLGAVVDQHAQQRQRDQQPEPVAQRRARPVDRLPGGAAADPERRRDLLVAQAFQLAHHDRRALRLGQGAQPLISSASLLAPLGFLGWAAPAGDRLGQLGLGAAGRAGR